MYIEVFGVVVVCSFGVFFDLVIVGYGYVFLLYFMLKEVVESGKFVLCLFCYRLWLYLVYMMFCFGVWCVVWIDVVLFLVEELVFLLFCVVG